jgi:hypothetical protein
MSPESLRDRVRLIWAGPAIGKAAPPLEAA